MWQRTNIGSSYTEHHYYLYLQILLARSPTDLAPFVEEVKNTAQNGQQQYAYDDDRNDHATALWWRKSTQNHNVIHFWTASQTQMRETVGEIRQAVRHSTVEWRYRASYTVQREQGSCDRSVLQEECAQRSRGSVLLHQHAQKLVISVILAVRERGLWREECLWKQRSGAISAAFTNLWLSLEG